LWSQLCKTRQEPQLLLEDQLFLLNLLLRTLALHDPKNPSSIGLFRLTDSLLRPCTSQL
jgi:hypothetical protein